MAKKATGPTFIQRSRNLRPSEKALFHQELGAGKSHVTRKFFELNANDEAAIVNRIDTGLQQAIRG